MVLYREGLHLAYREHEEVLPVRLDEVQEIHTIMISRKYRRDRRDTPEYDENDEWLDPTSTLDRLYEPSVEVWFE